MELDNLEADILWLEDWYSQRMLALNGATDDEKANLYTELRDIQQAISAKTACYERLKEVNAKDTQAKNDQENKEVELVHADYRNKTERMKAETEMDRLGFEREKAEFEKEKFAFEKEKVGGELEVEKEKLEVEREKLDAERRFALPDINKILPTVLSAFATAAICFTELKGNGFLSEKLLKSAKDIK